MQEATTKPLDILKIEAEIGKLMAETGKLNAESEKFRREARYMPFIASAAFIGGVVAVGKLIFAA